MSASSNVTKSVQTDDLPSPPSPKLGEATCTWIRDCTSPELVGSPCSGTVNGVHHSGFCYESSRGTLECGRALTGSGFRCARGSALITPGSDTYRRPLVAGCMDPSDAQYSSLAEVHVPAYCAHGADYRAGCMFYDAINFDRDAVQPAACRYFVYGCTSSNAVNYNSEASIDDGTCIARTVGCTVPNNAKGFNLVLNYNANANVLGGCELAVEGCMDSRAVNYASDATVNTVTWCIPRVVGCMMPTIDNPSSGFNMSVPTWLSVDGLSANYNKNATEHRRSMCTIYRLGCPDPTAINYDQLATVSGPCYYHVPGCLNPDASNYRCRANEGQTAPCDLQPPHVVTQHDKTACHWASMSPAPPATPSPPPAPPGYWLAPAFVRITFLASGDDLSVYTAAMKISIRDKFVALLRVATSDVGIEAVAGSVMLIVSIRVADTATADTVNAEVRAALGTSVASAEAFLGNGITLLALPSIDMVNQLQVRPPEASSMVWPIRIALIGGWSLLMLLLVMFLARVYARRRKRRVVDIEPLPTRARVDWTPAPAEPEEQAIKVPPIGPPVVFRPAPTLSPRATPQVMPPVKGTAGSWKAVPWAPAATPDPRNIFA